MVLNSTHAHTAYQHGQVAASSPLRIVVLLYEGAIRFSKQALAGFGDPSLRGQSLGRSHAIVSELLVSLDHEKGEEIAQRLEDLYRYVLDALIRANVEGERDALESCISVLETLAEGWREIERAQLAVEATQG